MTTYKITELDNRFNPWIYGNKTSIPRLPRNELNHEYSKNPQAVLNRLINQCKYEEACDFDFDYTIARIKTLAEKDESLWPIVKKLYEDYCDCIHCNK